MPILPTLAEITDILGQVQKDPSSLTLRECEPLFAVLRAAYNDQLEDQFESLDDEYIAATEGADELLQDTVVAIAHLPFALADGLVPELIKFLESDEQFYELAHALVAITFPITSGEANIQNDRQRDVLAAIIANQDIWDLDAMFADFLAPRATDQPRRSQNSACWRLLNAAPIQTSQSPSSCA